MARMRWTSSGGWPETSNNNGRHVMYEDQRTRPYGSPATARVFLHNFRSGSSGRVVIFALIAGLLGLLLGAASLAYLLSYRSTTTAQMQTMRQALDQEQSN